MTVDDLVAFLNERLGELENSGKPDRHTVFCGHDQIEFGDECKCGIPAFVLADVAAKRQMLKFWPDPMGHWSAQQADGARAMKARLLRIMAFPFADHPDYREDWRP